MSTIAVDNITNEQGSGRPNFTNGVQTSNINGGQIGGRRNLIINGDMRIAQRGTTETVSEGSNEGYATVDRWELSFNAGSGGAIVVEQSSDAPNGFSNSLKFESSTTYDSFSGTESIFFGTKLEGQDLQGLGYGTAGAKNIVLSFWIKSNNYFDPISVKFQTIPSQTHFVRSVTPTSSWTKHEISVPPNTIGEMQNNNGTGLRVYFTLAGTASGEYAGDETSEWIASRRDYVNDVGNFVQSSGNTFYITGVQLEVGDTATEFEHRSYGEELALCQRYYEVEILPNRTSYAYGVDGNNKNMRTTNFAATKRASPSVTILDTPRYFCASSLSITASTTGAIHAVTKTCAGSGEYMATDYSVEYDAEL